LWSSEYNANLVVPAVILLLDPDRAAGNHATVEECLLYLAAATAVLHHNDVACRPVLQPRLEAGQVPDRQTILAANPGQVAAYQGGKEGLLGFFVGQVMKETGGKANPKVVSDRLREKLQA
jgi:hypothetical protein